MSNVTAEQIKNMISQATNTSTSYEGSMIKTQIYLAIAFIIFLVIIIISGRILDDINKSSCGADPRIANAHKWAAWVVGLASAAAAITLIIFIVLFFVEF